MIITEDGERYWDDCRTCGATDGGACLTVIGRPMRVYHAARKYREHPGQGTLQITWE